MDFKQFYKTINFDINNEIRTVYQATQGDTKSRGLLVDLIVGGVKTPVTTEEMTFYALKPDGTRVMTQGVKEGTGFRIDFTNQTFAVPGVLLCTLVLSGTNGEKIADKKFKMTVDSSLEDGAIISEDERGILDRAFDLASDIVPRLEALDVPLLENLEQEVITARGTEPTLGERLDSDKAEIEAELALKADKSDTYTKAEVDGKDALKADLSEIETARGTEATLGARLDSTDAQLNDKANKVHEAWITPTLLNGHSQIDTARRPRFRKNDFGQLTIIGGFISANNNLAVFTLPSGHIPDRLVNISVFDSGIVAKRLLISTSGDVKLFVASAGIFYLDNITIELNGV